jgi:hypothetical protein
MAKNQNTEIDPYIVESSKQGSKFKGWFGRRPVKITAVIAAAALALGLAFTGGALAGGALLGNHDGQGFAHEFGQDREHKPQFEGQRPPKPGHEFEGDQDGHFKMDHTAPETANSPEISTP